MLKLYAIATALVPGIAAQSGSWAQSGNIAVPTNQWIEGECKGSRTNHPTGTADKAACLTWC
eukprot:COSAG01_NODE_22079_length_872_cov_2.404916_1_plen_61_part_10